jgi:type III secretion system YscQ/HrcQ family protein
MNRRQVNLIRSFNRRLGSPKAAWNRWCRECIDVDSKVIVWSAPLALSPREAARQWPQLRQAVQLHLRSDEGPNEQLVIELPLAQKLLYSFLRAPNSSADLPLASGQKGLLLFVLGWLFSEIPGPRRRIDEAPPLDATPPPESLVISSKVRFGSTAGTVWLIAHEDAVATGAHSCVNSLPESTVSRVMGSSVALPLVITRFTLALSEAAGLAPGDCVVLPSRIELNDGDAVGARLSVGSGSFEVAIDHSEVRVTGPFERRAATMSVAPSEQEGTTTLAEELEVEAVVELGRAELLASEVMSLAIGDVISLPKPIGSTVDVRIGGRLLARGELVDVDGETGVRLLEVFE